MSFAKIEVGCGIAREDDSRTAGEKAARQAFGSIQDHPLTAVLVFASVRYDLHNLLSGIKNVVGDVPLLGASTAGEICNGTHEKSVAVAELASPYLKVRIGVGQAVSADWQKAVHQAASSPAVLPFFSLEGNTIWNEMTQNGESAFGIVFSPGNTRRAGSRGHEILEKLRQLSLGRLPMFGGGAADDWSMEANYVFWGDRAYSDSLLVAVFQTSLQYGIAMAHGLRPSARVATVTKVHDHEVLELDGRPADKAYAELLEVSKEPLAGQHLTLTTGKLLGIRRYLWRLHHHGSQFVYPWWGAASLSTRYSGNRVDGHGAGQRRDAELRERSIAQGYATIRCYRSGRRHHLFLCASLATFRRTAR